VPPRAPALGRVAEDFGDDGGAVLTLQPLALALVRALVHAARLDSHDAVLAVDGTENHDLGGGRILAVDLVPDVA